MVTSQDIACDAGCGNPAKSWVQWGTDAKAQSGNLCEEHIRECWDMSNHASVTGVWIQTEPKQCL